MRPETRTTGSAALTVLAAISLTLLAPEPGVAAPQQEDALIRREVVVVGSKPVHRRVILDRIADRGYLGVQLLTLTPELRRHLGAPEGSGVLVSRVVEDSPAAAAGITVGDVIIAAGGEPVSSPGQLVGRVGHHREGDEIELELVRDGAPLALRATLAQSARRQVELGQFVWRTSGDEEPLVLDLGSETIERVIAVDPATINESVRGLLQRLEDQGRGPAPLELDDEQRRAELQSRIQSLQVVVSEKSRQLEEYHRHSTKSTLSRSGVSSRKRSL